MLYNKVMSFFSRTKQEEVVVLFDIGSGSVGGATVLVSPNKKPMVLSTIRKQFKVRDTLESPVLIQEMLLSLKDVAVNLQKETHMVPKKVYAVLSSPWSHASLRTIKREQSEPFLFTEKYGRDLIANEISQFKKENRDFDELIDKRVLNILLNEYEVTKPHNKRIKQAQMHLFLSLSSKELINSIEEVIMQTYHKNIKFTSQMFSDFMVVRDIFDTLNNFIIINVDEENTEVSVMQNDVLVGTATFPYGKNTLVRNLSVHMGKSISEVKSLLSMHKDSHLHEIYSKNIDLAIADSNTQWVGSLKSSLRSLFVDLFIPHNIFLATEKKSEKWFLELLKKENFPEFTTTEDSFNVIIGDTRILHDFCDFSLHADKGLNLTIPAIFINTINFS